VILLSSVLVLVAIVGMILYTMEFSGARSFENLLIKRKGAHAIGSSLVWYRGKEDWLFLGDAYNRGVAKLRLAIEPEVADVKAFKCRFERVVEAASRHGTKVVLIMGPDKPSIYPEYLPDAVIPSARKYSSFFLDEIKRIPNLIVYDPTSDLISLKSSEGLLYWRTDTHWNSKGAFLAYSGLCALIGTPVPKVAFKEGSSYRGDLIDISKLKDFPIHPGDNWEVEWNEKPAWTEKEILTEQKTSFGAASIVSNLRPLSSMHVWVLGDSYANNLKQYFNSTFAKVRYVGHSDNKLNVLPAEFTSAVEKPDVIVIVMVERSF
jgi:hypothetical protein